MITLKSDKSVIAAMDALESAVTNAGAKVVARVNHAKAAASVDMAMNEAEVLIFGNPKVGTLAMQADVRAALYLPMKIAIFDNGNGQTTISYDDPKKMFAGLDIPEDAEFLKVMTGALAKLSQAAV